MECISGLSAYFLYFAWILIFKTRFSLVVFYPLAYCGFILLQGAAYWKICLLRLDRKKTKESIIRKTYWTFRYANLFFAILYIPILFIFKESEKNFAVGIAFYGFSILEYINYYFVRLSYPLGQFFRCIKKMSFGKSRIAKELSKKE